MRRSWWLILLGVVLVSAVVVATLIARQPQDSPTDTAADTTTTVATKISLSKVVSGLANPTVVASIPEDKRLFVAERGGKVQVVSDGQIKSTPYIDLSSKVQANGEMGLLGMAFHPKISDGRFFVDYIDQDRNTIVSSFKTDRFNTVDATSEQILLKLAQPYTNHNGGDLHFGPDGYLYISMGDGGSAGDPGNRAQNLDNLFGKILRINVDGDRPYSIPADNPFVTTDKAQPEIWLYGLRNPWKFSFDREVADLWIADVGQGDIEEINYVVAGSKAGQNFGWRCYEGSQTYNTSGCSDKSSYTFPVLEYTHTEGRCSVTGGYVYRGQELAGQTGRYFYADYCGGQIYQAQRNGDSWVSSLVLDTNYQPSAFGEDGNGELYLTDFASGDLFKLVSKPE